MAVLVLKYIVDVCWYFAEMGAIMHYLPQALAYIAGALPLIYGIVLFLKRKEFAGKENSKDLFFWQCKILLLTGILMLPFVDIMIWENTTGLYSFLFLAAGVLLLRVTRLDDKQRNRRFYILNGGYIAAVILITVAATSDAMLHAGAWFIKTLYFRIIMPVLLLIMTLFGFVLNLFVQFLMFLRPDSKPGDIFEMFQFQNDLMLPQGENELNTLPPIFEYGFAVVVTIIIAALLWYVYKKLTVTGRRRNVMTKTTIVKEDRLYVKERKATKEEKAVRLYYKKFLKLCMKAGILISPAQSSGEIQEKAGEIWEREELSPLRDIYIRVRYSGRDVPDTEVNRAKEEYRKLKQKPPS